MGNKVVAMVLAWAILVPAVFLMALASSPAEAAAPITIAEGWFTGTLDSATTVSNYIDIAVDVAGNVHISYQDSSTNDLRYITNAGGVWSATTIDSAGITGSFNSIAVDVAGHAFISYYDTTNENLRYATNAGGSWATSTIDSIGNVGEYSSIGVDSLGKVHIAYYDYTHRAVKYATNTEGAWTNETVDDSSNAGYSYMNLAIDASDHVHLSYYDFEGDKVRYATNADGVWAKENVSTAGTTQFTTIALDSEGNPYVAFWGGAPTTLKVLTKEGDSWTTTVVDDATSIAWQVSMAIDSSDRLHISYFDNTGKDLVYASNASGTWKTDTVDSMYDVGFLNAIALDPNDKVHVAYIDSTHLKLKTATNAEARWKIQSVDSEIMAGFSNDIAVDSNNGVHIVYYDANTTKLMHAIPWRGGWQSEIIDAMPFSGAQVSMAIDGHDKIHAVYYNSEDDSLRYCTNAAGVSWAASTVDDTNDVGLWNSIAVDSSDSVHIAYVDATMGKLKYANNTAGGFAISFIDNTGTVEAAGVSIALNSTGIPFVCYIANNHLMLAKKIGPITWNVTTIDSSTDDLSHFTSMAIDSRDRLHITYYDVTLGALKYATNATGSWTTNVIDRDGDMGSRSILRLDANDGLHVLYLDNTNHRCVYSVNTEGVWMKTTLRDVVDVWACSLALDSNGRAHASYFDATNGGLKYAESIGVPSAPQEFEVESGNGVANLTWSSAINEGSDVTNFKVFKGTSAGNLSLLATLDSSNYSYQDVGLTNGVRVWYGVVAVNSEGMSVMAGPLGVIPATRPSAPLDLSAKAGDGQLELSWSAPSSNGGAAIIMYKVYRGDSASNLTYLGNTTGLGYTDSGLKNDATYYYAVSAVNDVGESPMSATAQGVPKGMDALLIVGIVAIIAIIAAALYFFVLRPRK